MSTSQADLDVVDPAVEKRYELREKLGKGAYGIVWRAIDRKTKQVVALKKAFDAFGNQTDAQRTYREVMFLQRVHHENVIRLHNVMRAANRIDLYLVFEIMETDLHATIRSNVLQDIHKQFITYQVLRTLRFLHNHQIIHRDLKPANVLLNSDCHVKLADFGLARSLENLKQVQQRRPELTDYIATRWYRPPEIVLGSTKYSKAVDMWAMGCLIGELLTGKPLLPGTSTINQLERIVAAVGFPSPADVQSLNSKFADQVFSSLPSIPPNPLAQALGNCSPDAVDLIIKLMHFNPEKRITCAEAMRHPYVAQFCTEAELRPDPPAGAAITVPLPDCERYSVDEYREALYKEILRRKKEVKRRKRVKEQQRAMQASSSKNQSQGDKSMSSQTFRDDEYEDDFT